MRITDMGGPPGLAAPDLRPALAIRADLGAALEFPTTDGTVRAVFPIVGGILRGSGLDGEVLPGGADFALRLPDGAYAITARYAVRLSDGTPLVITNAGRMVPQPDGSFLGRTRAEIEVPDGPHGWMGRAVFLGTALAEAGDEARVWIELWQAVLPGDQVLNTR
jgi:hypothetical protein